MIITERFIDRKDELAYLNSEYAAGGFKFISVIGRRRVGKTRLIEEFIKNKKKSLYFFVQELNDMELRLSLAEILHKEFNSSFLGTPSWNDIFEDIFKISEKSRTTIIFDEFQRFLGINKSVPSILQGYIDKYAKKSMLFLVVMGSSIGMMHRLFDHTSALYGRRTGQLNIQPLHPFYLKEWFPAAASAKELIEIYAVFGGTPKYLESVNPKQTILENIKNNILSKKSILYNEPEILIKTELPNSATYFNILKLIAEGKTTPSEIAGFLSIKQTSLSYFLNVLEIDMELIKRDVAVTEKKQGSKKALYKMNDNFFKFWFRYVYPYKSAIEMDNIDSLIEKIRNEINSFVGVSFEDVCKSTLLKLSKTSALPFKFSRMGSWWGFYRDGGLRKELEIDIVALNESAKDIMFSECKWQDKVDAKKILAELKEKSKYVQWNNESRSEHYAVFAKSFKEKIKEPNILLFDMSDFEKMFQKNI